jgi:transposase-like protein
LSKKQSDKPIFEYTSGPASQSQKEIMHSNYGILPTPQVNGGKYQCPMCHRSFENLDSYNLHRHEGDQKNVKTQTAGIFHKDEG